MPVDDQSLLPHKASECPPRDSASMGQPKNDRANRSTIVIGFLHGRCPALRSRATLDSSWEYKQQGLPVNWGWNYDYKDG